MRAVKYSERRCRRQKIESEVHVQWRVCAFCDFPHPCLHLFFFFLSFFPPCFILSFSPLNLPTKSTLAMGNYNEQLHMAAPPAAKIRRGSTALSHTHTHTHTHTIPYLISIVTEQPPSAQFCPNLLRKQYWYFTAVRNERRREGDKWGGGQRGGRGRRKRTQAG